MLYLAVNLETFVICNLAVNLETFVICNLAECENLLTIHVIVLIYYLESISQFRKNNTVIPPYKYPGAIANNLFSCFDVFTSCVHNY